MTQLYHTIIDNKVQLTKIWYLFITNNNSLAQQY